MWFQWSQYVTKSRILNITLFPVIQIKLVSGVADNTESLVLGNLVTGYCKFTFLLCKRFGTHFSVMCSSTQACVRLCVCVVCYYWWFSANLQIAQRSWCLTLWEGWWVEHYPLFQLYFHFYTYWKACLVLTNEFQ